MQSEKIFMPMPLEFPMKQFTPLLRDVDET